MYTLDSTGLTVGVSVFLSARLIVFLSRLNLFCKERWIRLRPYVRYAFSKTLAVHKIDEVLMIAVS